MRVIKTGICSYGMSGKLFHAPFLENHPGYSLNAIVERHRSESREKYPQTTLYRSFEALIADPSIELVVVNTPVQTHFPYTKAALEAGKHVVTEKPFTVDADEAEQLDQLAKEKGLLLSVYQNRRYDGDFRAIREVVDQQLLGPLREVELKFDRYRVEPSGKTHKEADLPGAGNLHDLGAHLIDQALQLFGMPQAVFGDLLAMRENLVPNDYFELILFYERLRVRVKATLVARATGKAYLLHGVNGSFLQARSDVQEQELLKGVTPSQAPWCPAPSEPDGFLHTTVDGKEVVRETTSEPGNYMGYYDDLYAALTGQRPNPVPAADAVATMRIIDAAFRSDREKRVIALA